MALQHPFAPKIISISMDSKNFNDYSYTNNTQISLQIEVNIFYLHCKRKFDIQIQTLFRNIHKMKDFEQF